MTRESLPTTQARKLVELLGAVLPANAFWRRKLEGRPLLRSAEGCRLEDLLAALPLTTKDELQRDQEIHPPFGSNLTYPLGAYTRIHRTSGTTGRALWWLDTPASWEWFLRQWDEIFRGAAVGPSDRIFFPFSFGPFVGFWAAFEASARHGCLSVPGGGMTTTARLRVLLETGATVVAATPTYALHMAEVACAEGLDLPGSAVRVLLLAGEPGGSIPETRARIEQAWGARCFDHCGMTEVGPVGFECLDGPGGMHVIEPEFIAEVVDPRTGAPVPCTGGAPAEGELVVTSLGRLGSPLIRYRTGDLVRLSRAPCPCGRPYARLEGGILGRTDDMVFIRGNNLYPSAVEAIIRRFPEVAEFRSRVRRRGEMTTLEVEVEPARGAAGPLEGPGGLRERIERELERTLLFRPEVRLVPGGSLPRFELKAKRFFNETTR
ncbi:MAG: phenylacetate--CoA ligase family protein [Planctomycetes bacterium]|nr:phenylacetate--CoA ligase family protein [Planctomycetota bacterium]